MFRGSALKSAQEEVDRLQEEAWERMSRMSRHVASRRSLAHHVDLLSQHTLHFVPS